MTVEAATPIVLYTVSGIGPYTIPWPYLPGTIGIAVAIDGVYQDLAPEDYTVTPETTTWQGNAFLMLGAALLHAGKPMMIMRRTEPEQGWGAVLGEREKGLEAQLDALTMAQQEMARDLSSTLRVAGADMPVLDMPADTVPLWDGEKFVPGPRSGEIASANDAADRAEAAAAAADADALHVAEVLASIDVDPNRYGRPVRRLHVADGATTTFAMPANALGIGSLLSVHIDGVAQDADKYTVTGGILTLLAAPRAGERVQITAWTAALAEDANTRRAYAFATRAALIAALGWPWEIGAVVSDGAVQYEYLGTGTVIPDMPGWVPYGLASLEHWGGSTSATAGQRNTAMVNAMAWLNVGNRTLKLPDGDVSFTATWPALTGTRSNIIGPNTRVILASTATTGSMLVFGTDSLRADNCVVDVSGWIVNSDYPNDPLVRFHNTLGCKVYGRIDNCNSVAVFGGATTTASNSEMDLRGIWTRGANCDQVILIQNAANLRITGNLTCGVACNDNANGAYIRIKPVTGGSVDTVRFNGFGAQGFNALAANRDLDHQSKPYGLVLDLSDGEATNVSFDGFCFLDHTSVAAVLYKDTAGGTFFGRAIQFTGMRFGSCYGQFAKLVKLSGAAQPVQIDFSDIAVLQRGLSSAPTMEISGAGWIGCQFTSSAIRDSYTTPRGAAVQIASDGWMLADLSIGTNTSAASQFTVGVDVTSAALVNVVVRDIKCDPTVPEVIREPLAYTTANAPRRQIVRDIQERDIAFLIPVAGEYVGTTTGTESVAVQTVVGITGRLQMFPFTPRADLSIDRIAAWVTTGVASAQVKLGVYTSDAQGRPATKIFESAAQSAATTASAAEATCDLTLARGRTYWIAVQHSSTATLAAWPREATPTINGGAINISTPMKSLRRDLTFADPMPTSWVWNTSEVQTTIPPAVWLRAR